MRLIVVRARTRWQPANAPGGNPNDDLAALSFSHQRMAYGLSQIVPLAVIIVAGVVFYALGRPTRQDVATEPVTASIGPAWVADRAT